MKEGILFMKKDVVLDESNQNLNLKTVVDKKVLKCYYNICKYYNKKYGLIKKYLGEIQAKYFLKLKIFNVF